MQIKGVNLGGWLLMEGYILGGRNISESEFKTKFKKIYGKKELERFEDYFRRNFIREIDFQNIKQIGANTVRIPFHYKIVKDNKIEYLKDALNWALKYNIKVILDLHAAEGSQNKDWHSDSSGEALLWENKIYQDKTIELWQKVASFFKEHPALLGYDILNEPVLGKKSPPILKNLYKKIIQAIRQIDKKSIVFLEGDIWAQRVDFLEDLIEENIQISIHTYQPLDYTFNFTPFYSYPGEITGVFWDKNQMQKYLQPYYEFSCKNNVKIYVGEFGINWRGGFWGETLWLQDILELFKKFNFGCTYWTYKAVAQNCFPDGLYQYITNSKFIRREGPIYGWENYLFFWEKNKSKIIDFWKTENCQLNTKLAEILQKFFKE